MKELLSSLLPKEEAIFIFDSTGIPHRGLNHEIKWMRGKWVRKVRGHSRICALIRYFRKEKLLVLDGISVGRGYSDFPLGEKALECASYYLLVDGFDPLRIWAKSKEKGLKPIIPLKGGDKG